MTYPRVLLDASELVAKHIESLESELDSIETIVAQLQEGMATKLKRAADIREHVGKLRGELNEIQHRTN